MKFSDTRRVAVKARLPSGQLVLRGWCPNKFVSTWDLEKQRKLLLPWSFKIIKTIIYHLKGPFKKKKTNSSIIIFKIKLLNYLHLLFYFFLIVTNAWKLLKFLFFSMEFFLYFVKVILKKFLQLNLCHLRFVNILFIVIYYSSNVIIKLIN